VHRRARRRGAGAALLRGAEDVARSTGRSLLVLDTASADAERLYERGGWQRVGTVPGFALMPDGSPCDTTFFYRLLDPS
jgi:GNAT superfamily N-acetyltransferase